MSTPETPPPNPTTPVAPDAASAPIESSSAPSETTTNGAHSGAGDEGGQHASGPDEAHPGASDAAGAAADDGSAEEGEGEEAGSPAEGAAAPAAGEKKRRRRRRKKKGGVTAGAGGEGAPAAEGQEPSAETPEGEAATGEAGAAAPRPDKGDRRDKRKERDKDKKHAPPRERPPVNAGDIVFGKIVDITEEAIFVDIPGKARAIFDRREMLLPEDDEADRSRASAGPATAPSPGAPPPAAVADALVSVDGDTTTAPPGEAAGLDAANAAPSPEAEPASATPAGSDALASTSVDAAAPTRAAEPEPPLAGGADAPTPPAAAPVAPAAVAEAPREPKVPRVILEVGADFIAVVHNDGARGGLVVLTHHPHRAERIKPVLEKALQDKTTVLGLVTGVIKGGIEVDVDGLRAFAPGSHVDLRMGADLSYLVGSRLPFFVTQYAKRGRDVVLSRKSLIEEEARKARAEALAKLKVGEELEGIVRSVVPFGAFVDIGGVEGLVPLQEMSHNRGDGPSDVFKAGEPTRVKVIKIDDRGKVWLSRKATIPDPWQQVAEKYATGTRHTGKVARLQPFGAFVELEPGVDGLIHTQDLSIKRIEAPGEVVKVGDPIEVVVAHLDPTQHKIALHPAPQGDLASEAPQRVAPHKPVRARVVAIESGGLVVRILGVTGRNARGYITSAGTGTPRGTELRKAFNVGQDVEAKVVEIDPRRGEIKLSIKALSEDQERSAYQQYRQQLKAEARFTLADLLTKKGSR